MNTDDDSHEIARSPLTVGDFADILAVIISEMVQSDGSPEETQDARLEKIANGVFEIADVAAGADARLSGMLRVLAQSLMTIEPRGD